ncbi:major facilitator superfamily domain-containing protein [Mycena latifolia]|nr:major facilitator superfamily domain-containing protein [Mycena latifolia]
MSQHAVQGEAATVERSPPRLQVEPTPPSSQSLNTPLYPDGGLHAWSTVAGSFLVQFCGVGYASSFGVYQDFYVRDYLTHSSSSAISSLIIFLLDRLVPDIFNRWVGSVNVFLVISGGLVVGRLYDRGHFKLLVYGGCFIQCFSLFMLSLCKRDQLYQIFLAQGLGAGVGAGAAYIPSIAVVSHYFKKRTALAMSIAASGVSLGSVIHPIMLNNTLQRLGFGNAVRASAALVSGLLLIGCLLMHPKSSQRKEGPEFSKTLRRFGRDKAYVFSTIGMALYAVGYYFPLFYLQLDTITHGINQSFAFYSLVILNASGFVGRIGSGLFARSLGVVNMITVSAGCGGLVILGIIGLKSIASVVVLAVIYGFLSGVYISSAAPLLALLTEDVGELGLRIGIAFAAVGLGGLVGPPIHGALLTENFVWWRPTVFSGLMAVLGSLFFVATLITVRKKNARKSVIAQLPIDEKAD